MERSLRVVLFYRAAGSGFSMERLFTDVCRVMPPEIETSVAQEPCKGTHPLTVLRNSLWAMRVQGEVNHVTGGSGYLASLLRKRRTVLTIHDCVSLHRLRGWRRWIFRCLWYTIPVRRAAVVTVISEHTKQELLQWVDCPAQKIRVIHNCVSPDFRPSPKEFNDRTPVVLQMGTTSNKNLERVIEALEGITCHLRIVGKLEEESRRRRQLEAHGIDYSWVSNISDAQIVEEYRRCDLLVFASTYEGFGLPIVEAQATGRPVVTSQLAPMPEVAGKGACFVDPWDPHSIRAGVLRVIRHPGYRSQLITEGYVNVRRFSVSTVAEKYREVYEALAKRGSEKAGIYCHTYLAGR